MPNYKNLLFFSDYPPSTVAGAPVIVRQLLRTYDMDRLGIVCCKSWYENQKPVVRDSFLPCSHTVIPSARSLGLRPRRIFSPILGSIDCFRKKTIMAEGRKLIRERNVEAIFTAPYGYEFTAAAYELAMEFGLEFFIFETDEWDQNNATIPLGLRRVRAEHATVLRAATKRWFTSPAMVRVMKEKFGVDGDFLFHFVDTAHYAAARERVSPPSDRIVIIYTGSINVMFEQTMKPFCDWLNAGVTIEGLPVEMVIYTHLEPKIYMGPHVRWGGFVAIEEIATKLAEAHVATVLVSFADDPMTQQMIRTSLYTKTIDYLAAGTPTLVVSPPYSAEVDYFGGVTEVVDTLDFARIEHALRSMALDDAHRTELRLRGEELVAGRHSMQALQRIFLRYFERAGS